MTLAERVRNRPLFVVGGAVFLLLLLGVVAVTFSEGTFLQIPSGCEKEAVRHPQTNETYSDFSEFEQDALEIGGLTEEEFAQWQEKTETSFEDVDGDGVRDLMVKQDDCIKGVQQG